MIQHTPNNELARFIVDHGYSLPDINATLEFKSRNAFRDFLKKRRDMPVERWATLGKILNVSVEEMLELYKEEVK